MPPVQRKGDPNTAGGIAVSGVNSVRVNGRPIVVNGISVSPHPCCGQKGCPPVHCNASTQQGVSSVRAGGIPVVVNGSMDSCNHPRTQGSPNVTVGG